MAISRIGTDGIDQTSSQQIGGISVGRGGGAVSTNTAVGASALASNSTGGSVTAVGYQALYTNTVSNNDAFGRAALYSNTSGDLNAAFGQNALYSNTTGASNAAFGVNSGYANTTGSNNVFFGKDALRSNTTASNNTAVGYQAGYTNVDGANNVFVGYKAGYTANTSGGHTLVGYNAGTNVNSSSVANTFFGNGAGDAVTSGSKNTIIGRYSGNNGGLNISTSSNYIVLSDGDGNPRAFWDGNGTGYSYSASSNAFNIQYTGSWASGNANFVTMYMPNMSGGTAGIALGRGGGTYNTSKIIFGYSGSNSTSNYLGLGFWDADSRLTIYPTGNATLTGSLTQNSSDQRLKTNVIPISGALAKVCLLRGFTYNWNDLAFELNHLNREVREVGVFAQDVKDVLPEAVFIAPFDQERGNPSQSISGEEYLTVQYEKLTPLLIEAIKELKAEFDAYKAAHP